MIKSIEIKNFQSHKDSRLELHPGVNVIVGSTDSGKSAVLRAIRWAVWNQPLGDGFRSWWAGRERTEVRVDLGETSVTRYKTLSDNVYSTPELGEFRAFRNDPPAEISEVLNLSDLNLQKQSDKYFLISDTSGAVAAHFNRIANLEQIDIATRYSKSQVNSTQLSIKNKAADLKGKKEELRQYDFLDDAETRLEELDKIEIRQEELRERIGDIQKIIHDIKETQSSIEVVSELTRAESQWEYLLAKHQRLETLKNKSRILNRLTRAVEKIEKETGELTQITKTSFLIESLLDTTDKLKNVKQTRNKLTRLANSLDVLNNKIHRGERYLEAEPMVANMGLKLEEIRELEKRHLALFTQVEKLQNTENKIVTGNDFLKTRTEEWEELVPEVCPLCEKPFTNKHKH